MEGKQTISHIFKSNQEVYTMSSSLINNSNPPESDTDDPNKLLIKIESESKVIFCREFSSEELNKEDSVFKKFEVKEVFEMLLHNCSDNTIKFEKTTEKCFTMLLSFNFNKKNFNPILKIPLISKTSTIAEKSNDCNTSVEVQNLLSKISLLEEKVEELSKLSLKKKTTIITFFADCDCSFPSNNGLERHFQGKYTLNNSKIVEFELDSNTFYRFDSTHYNFDVELKLRNITLGESTSFKLANIRCLEQTQSQYKIINISKRRAEFLNKGQYEIEVVFKKINSSLSLYITDLILNIID